MLLTILTFFPSFAALALFLLPNEKFAKHVALVASIVTFLLSLTLFKHFDRTTASLQLVENYDWIPSIGVNYFIGVDGISFWLLLLTTFLTPIALLSAWSSIDTKVKGFCMALLFLETTMIGTFVSMNAILFYCFFEASLIPMYFIIGIWGGARKLYATMKFFIYTMAGSIFLLVGIITLMLLTRGLPEGQVSGSLLDFYRLNIPFVAEEFFNLQTILFFAVTLAFAIKVPVFPFHTWLPDAHVEAPTPGSIILAGVLLKMGTYGMMRFSIPIFPEAAEYWSWVFMLIGVVGIIYGALVAMVQPDVKKLVAYSSVSHMGYILIGLFALNESGTTGAMYQMLNHGVSTGALFLLVGMVYERTHTREIKNYGGLASAAPLYAIAFLIVTLSSIAVPMTNGFVGEFLILLGAFTANAWYGGFAVAGVVLGAAYMLWMVKKIFYGEERGAVLEHKAHGLDMNLREILTVLPLIVLIFWMGLFPNHFFKWSEKSLEHFVKTKANYELSVKTDAKNKSVAQRE